MYLSLLFLIFFSSVVFIIRHDGGDNYQNRIAHEEVLIEEQESTIRQLQGEVRFFEKFIEEIRKRSKFELLQCAKKEYAGWHWPELDLKVCFWFIWTLLFGLSFIYILCKPRMNRTEQSKSAEGPTEVTAALVYPDLTTHDLADTESPPVPPRSRPRLPSRTYKKRI